MPEHGSTKGRSQELLYDPKIPTPTHAERAVTLVAQAKTGTLSTLSVEPTGFPYGSFVTFGFEDGSPIFLISELAEHTKNLRGESRCSLLVAEPGEGDPLARGRVTMVGRCRELQAGAEQVAAREAFLSANPRASYYVDFTDFSLWKLDVEQVRYIGGYGRMSWVDAADWSAAEPDPMSVHAPGIVQHMNEDHPDALVLYCKAFSKAQRVEEATMVGIDRYGFEMSAMTPEGPRPIRVAFDAPISSPGDSRDRLVELAKRARAQLA